VFCPQIGADGGRKWQMVDFLQNLAPRRSRRMPRWLSHRNGEATACAVTTPRTSAAITHFAKPARIPRRNRAESPKTIPRTVQEIVRKSNNRPNFRMVGAHATRFLFDRPRGAPAWHYPGGHPRSANVPAKTGRSGTPPRPHETLAPTPCAEKTRYAAPIGGLSGRITGRQRNENRGCVPNVPQTWRKRGGSVV
jgi:hypothetical protein